MTPVRRRRLRRWLLVLGRVALGFIFFFAAYGKLRPIGTAPFTPASFEITGSSLSLSMMTFAMQVDAYHLLPNWGVMFVSHVLPWFELGLVVLLLSGLALRWVALVTAGLFAVFLGAIVHSYIGGLQINCGCFGPGAEPVSKLTILRDSLFFALAAGVTIGAFFEASAKRKQRSEVAMSQVGEAVSADPGV